MQQQDLTAIVLPCSSPLEAFGGLGTIIIHLENYIGS